MATTLALTADELRIIAHTINWELNVAYEHTPAPARTEEERQILRILFNELCTQQNASRFAAKPLLIRLGRTYSCEDGWMQLPRAYLRLMTDAMASFLAELGHSPTEIEVVTGLPASSLTALLSRMRIAS